MGIVAGVPQTRLGSLPQALKVQPHRFISLEGSECTQPSCECAWFAHHCLVGLQSSANERECSKPAFGCCREREQKSRTLELHKHVYRGSFHCCFWPALSDWLVVSQMRKQQDRSLCLLHRGRPRSKHYTFHSLKQDLYM